MKCIFKKTLSGKKKTELDEVRDNPTFQRKAEAEKTNYTFEYHGEDNEEPVVALCCFFPRRSSHRPSHTLLDKSPFLGEHLPLHEMWSFNGSHHIQLHRRHCNICDVELMEKGSTDDFERMSLEGSPVYEGDMLAQPLRATPCKHKRRKCVWRRFRKRSTSQQNTGITLFRSACDRFECSREFRAEDLLISATEKNPDVGCSSLLEAEPPVMTEQISVSNTLPPTSHFQFSSTDSSCLTRSHSVSSLSKIPKNNLTRAASLPDMKLKEFTPDISADDFDETYRFRCFCPGLYQCSVTGLVFVMKGEGDVVYRTVPWNRRLLAQHHKKPAGPLFDIKCLQQSVCQLHLPHCEIISTGGGQFLQVAHVNDEGIEFISPHKITETHVVINITGFSGYGNVKDEDSPPDPVQALVLLFYKPPDDPDFRCILSVLLLPRNIVIRDVQRTRKKLIGDEKYIDTSPHCKLHPKRVYILSTAPEDDLIKVQPKETEFDEEYHESYFTSFQVILQRTIQDVNLSLRDKSTSSCVWESEVYLLPNRLRTVTVPPNKRLFNVRSCFIDGISGPVLNSLLDKLLEKKVITHAEREAVDAMQIRSERARFVFDTVCNKGKTASSVMIEFLCEEDPFLCEHLGLKQNGEVAHA